jgi:hypothetical protein
LLSLASYCYRHRQTLFGVAHASGSGFGTSSTSNAFAASFSGGVDVNLFHRLSWRPVQVEYLLTRSRKPQRTAKRRTISASRPASFSISKFHVTDGLLGISGRKFQAAIQIDLPLRFTDGVPLG